MVQLQLPEQIVLELKPASFGSRALAYTIDWTIRWTITLFVGIVLLYALLGLSDFSMELFDNVAQKLEGGLAMTMSALALMLLFVFAFQWSYSIYFEVLRGGATPGKKAVGLRVVNEHGLPVSFQTSLIRNVFLLIDILPILGCVAMGSILLTARRQRLGDLVARTLVIYDDRMTQASVASEPGAKKPLPADLYVMIENFLDRSKELNTQSRQRLGWDLCQLSLPYLGDLVKFASAGQYEEALRMLLNASYPSKEERKAPQA